MKHFLIAILRSLLIMMEAVFILFLLRWLFDMEFNVTNFVLILSGVLCGEISSLKETLEEIDNQQ